MLPFQKTSLYQKSLQTVNELLQSFEREHSSVIKKKVEEEALCLTTALAKGLEGQNSLEKETQFKVSNDSTLGLLSLMDVAKNLSSLEPKKIDELKGKLFELMHNLGNFEKNRKRVLILSCNMGKAHMSASNAIAEGLLKTFGYDYNVEIIDFMEFMNSSMNKITLNAYEGSVKFMPHFYKMFYESTDKKWPVKFLNQINYPFVLSKLKKFFEEKQPDLIVSTFPLWDYVTSEIWKKYNKNAKFMSIITDSTSIHKFWLIADVDYRVVCNKDTAYVLEKLGADPKTIKVLGFPVRLDFLEKLDRESFFGRYDLDHRKKTLLFLPTAQSAGLNVKIMKKLIEKTEDFNIFVITGRDSKIKPKLEKIARGSNVKIFGWTDEMPRFIKAADIVITKAGGATVMECIAAEKPMIITSVIPGQEQGNAELIMDYNLGIVLDESEMDLSQSIENITRNYSRFQSNLKKQSIPDAALKIAEFIGEIL